MLRFITAGESHGPGLTAIVEGLPAGLPLDSAAIDAELARRQSGYGRGARQQIERDHAEIVGGAANGVTIGAPVALWVENRDWANWRDRVIAPWTRPRPGHADLAGAAKYGLTDLRLVAERASARETAARVAAGAVAKALLVAAGISVGSYVEMIGGEAADVAALPLAERLARARQSDVSCPDPIAAEAMRRRIDWAREAGESLGGVIVAVAIGAPTGLGSHTQWDRRLDAKLAAAVMSVQAIKGVEIGDGFAAAALPGTQAHDALYPGERGPIRRTNHAGGVEGGISNGEPILVRAAMKPIPTTVSPQPTVDLAAGQAAATQYQRSDVCAVPAAAVVIEAMIALTLADALLERYGGDDLATLVNRVRIDREIQPQRHQDTKCDS